MSLCKLIICNGEGVNSTHGQVFAMLADVYNACKCLQTPTDLGTSKEFVVCVLLVKADARRDSKLKSCIFKLIFIVSKLKKKIMDIYKNCMLFSLFS